MHINVNVKEAIIIVIASLLFHWARLCSYLTLQEFSQRYFKDMTLQNAVRGKAQPVKCVRWTNMAGLVRLWSRWHTPLCAGKSITLWRCVLLLSRANVNPYLHTANIQPVHTWCTLTDTHAQFFFVAAVTLQLDRNISRLNSRHIQNPRMPSYAVQLNHSPG